VKENAKCGKPFFFYKVIRLSFKEKDAVGWLIIYTN